MGGLVNRSERGFTLIEVLIALAIVGVALGACIRAVGLGADGVRAMQERSLALWAGQNRLAELRLQRTFPDPGERSQPCPQGPLALVCEERIQNSGNTHFRQVRVRVHLADGPVLAELHGLLSILP
ncbi:type II secretion system minor pseudopilin GspI [Thauera aromatica]|uniref:type II secretion system minor pseudopilin GspI n=1 Tax=Thauera aromatica TaxID=59405 RepID=UPI001FFCF9C8|nr:type II secretion system minor pseudopilin GspI [Thauera aromatica]MCK2094555.1 type II secretion system minor pseudopilin GspI [Thauera aromatica]